MFVAFFGVLFFTVSFLILLKKLQFKSKLKRRTEETGNGLRHMPGPWNLPILGSVPSILFRIKNLFSKPSYEILTDISRKWGSPTFLKFGALNIVLIDDVKTAKKLMSGEEWANRMDSNPIWYTRSFGKHYGLLLSNGESWKAMRRFFHMSLTKYGFGRTPTMDMMHETEILNFFEHLDKKREVNGNVIDTLRLLSVSTFNILWEMIAGTKFSHDDWEINKLMELMQELLDTIQPQEFAIIPFPWIRHFPSISAYKKLMGINKKFQDYVLNVIQKYREAGKYLEKPGCLIEDFLWENKRHEKEGISPNYYTDEQLATVLIDFFMTGFGPTSACINYLILFMMRHPEIQTKCHEEVDAVVGTSRYPSINDNDKMVYTQAAVLEVLRLITILPVTGRTATRDTKLDDYFLPKDTLAVINLHGMHNDKDVWGNPDQFSPDRFLDESGQLCNQDLILPFGTGKRVCPGEVLGRVSTFTYFAYLLQKYSFECPPNCEMPDITPVVGLGSHPKPFKCLIKERRPNSGSSTS